MKTPAKKTATKKPAKKAAKATGLDRMKKPLAKKAPVKKKASQATKSPMGTRLRIKVKDLCPHPLLSRVGLLPGLIAREERLGKAQGKSRNDHQAKAEELESEFLALSLSIEKGGMREPIKVVREAGGWFIVDGRHRWEAAKDLIGMGAMSARGQEFAINGVPCIEVKEADAPAIIMDAVNRRHMSKGAKAYLAVIINPEVVTAEKRGKSAAAALLTQEELAKRTGVSLRTMKDACEVFRLLSREDLRKRFEDGIWVGDGLDRIIAGVKGFLEKGKTEDSEESEKEREMRLANQWVSTGLGYFGKLERYWAEYARFDPEQEHTVSEKAAAVIAAAPPSIKAAVLAVLLPK